LAPPPAAPPTDWLRFARWGAAAFTALTTGIQLTVWAMIAVVTQSIDSPWWLWSAVPGVAVTAFLTWMINTRDQLGIETESRAADAHEPAPSALA
jgi:hypothetical protein